MYSELARTEGPLIITAEDILRQLRAAVAADPAVTRRHVERIIARLAGAMGSDACDGHQRPDGAHALASWQCRRVTAYIDANLDQRIAIRDLAVVSRLSVSYFFRAFRGSFGDAPHAFIVRRRVEQAQRRLREGETPIAQVALNCGFADQAHFSRVFMRYVGCPPGAWRRRNRANDPRADNQSEAQASRTSALMESRG